MNQHGAPVGASEHDEVRHLLLRMPFFRNLSDRDAEQLMSLARLRDVGAGELIFEQGDPGDALYVVLSGRIRIFFLTPEGELDLATPGAGDSFGELSLIDGAPRSASAQATEPSRLVAVLQDDYLRMISNSRSMLADLLSRVSESLRRSNFQLAGLAEQKTRAELEAEVERLGALSQMVAGVAHELNTPLGVIRSAASVMAEALRPEFLADLARNDAARETLEDVAAACQLVDKNVQSAHRLVQAFKSLSVRQLADRREQVDLLSLLQETADAYGPQARRSGLSIEVRSSLPPDRRSWDGFPGLMSQVLLNFFGNAERYAYPEGGGKVLVTLEASELLQGQPGFEIAVRDFGHGIDPKNLPHIFTPFFTTGRSRGGTGLGLSVVHGIVTSALGGTIKVQSTPSQGATFLVRVPTAAPERAHL